MHSWSRLLSGTSETVLQAARETENPNGKPDRYTETGFDAGRNGGLGQTLCQIGIPAIQ